MLRDNRVLSTCTRQIYRSKDSALSVQTQPNAKPCLYTHVHVYIWERSQAYGQKL